MTQSIVGWGGTCLSSQEVQEEFKASLGFIRSWR